MIHQSGARINPLAHSALPDAEANIIRNLMKRIDDLEGMVRNLQREKRRDGIENGGIENGNENWEAQSLKDKEIIEYLGE